MYLKSSYGLQREHRLHILIEGDHIKHNDYKWCVDDSEGLDCHYDI